MELAALIEASKQSIRRVIQLHAAGLDEDTIIQTLVGEALMQGIAPVQQPVTLRTNVRDAMSNAKQWHRHECAIGIPEGLERTAVVRVTTALGSQYDAVADAIDWPTVTHWRHV